MPRELNPGAMILLQATLLACARPSGYSASGNGEREATVASNAAPSQISSTPSAGQATSYPVVIPEDADGYSVVVQSTQRFSVFTSDPESLAVLTEDNSQSITDIARPLRVYRIKGGVCTDLGTGPAAFVSGVVDLNQDPKRRWGSAPGGAEAWHGYRNSGVRQVVGAGILESGIPWVALQTAARSVAIDVYLYRDGRWVVSAESVWGHYNWRTAVSRHDLPGVVAVEGDSPNSVPSLPSRLKYWSMDQPGSTRPLGVINGDHSIERASVISAFNDGSVVVLGSTDDHSFVVERIEPKANKTLLSIIPEVKVQSGCLLNTSCPQQHKQFWGVQFQSSTEFVLWRLADSSLKFIIDAVTGRVTHHPDLTFDAPLRRMFEHFSGRLCGVDVLSDGTLLAVVISDNKYILVSDHPVIASCAGETKRL